MLLISVRPGMAGDCPATRIDERVRVVHVFDGDTVKLGDGRRVRLIGINTPEMARHGESGETLAPAARSGLQDMLDHGNGVLLLQYDAEHTDHYGRLLAHAYLENGDNVATELLKQGLATALVVPPNTRLQDCYQRIEDEARIDRRGLWALPQYQTLDSAALSADTHGFHVVRGRVKAVRDTSRSTWVELQGPLQLHISHRDRTWFAPGYLESLDGHEIEARGWIKTGSTGLRMNIRHPAALAKLSAGKRNRFDR